jgi:hypothetical protein
MEMTDKDRDLEQAWRAASSEEPPKTLDDKILAAAHRAAGSAPRNVPEATSPQRWWMPLLAAAVIGVVAVGIVQLVPNEQVVVDTPPNVGMLAKKETKNEPAAAPAAPPAAPPAYEPPKVQEAPATRATPLPPAPAKPQAAAPMEQKLAAPEPFPKKTDAARDSLTENTTQPQPQQNMDRKDAPLERQVPAAPSAPPSAPPAAAAPAPMSAPGRAMMRAQSDYATAAGALSQNVAPEEEKRRKARDPDAWIAEIRKLRTEGRTEDALRELKAFRETVPEPDKKLPPDLRDWKP